MSIPMSQSPVSDPGYGSSTSTPWLDKEDCDRFPGSAVSREEEDAALQHTLLQMEDGNQTIDYIAMDPPSPSPPPYQQQQQHTIINNLNPASSSFRHHQQSRSMFVSTTPSGHHSSKPSLSSSRNHHQRDQDASISTRRAINGLLPLSITTLSPPSIRLDLPAPAVTSFYDSGMYWL